MKIKINDQKASEIFFADRFLKTNQDIDIDLSTALRLSRVAPVDFDVPRPLPYDARLFKDHKFFNFTSDIDATSGWGNVSLNLLKWSKDYRVALIGRVSNVQDPVVNMAKLREVNPEGAMIWHEQPKHTWLQSPFDHNIAIVPFETTRIPYSWVSRINNCKALLVPCKQNIQMMRDSGVDVPIELIHWGVDPSKFSKIERESNRPFTFGHMGALSRRKGTDLLVEAFSKAFPNREDVRMICKTSGYGYEFMTPDKRIQVQVGPVPHEDIMNNFFKRIDVFMFPTRGEGFGLPALEALALGIPTIATGWSGIVEFLNNDVGWLIDYTMVPAKDFTEKVYKEDCGNWAEPSLDHLIYLMRYAYEHQDEVKAKGDLAAEYVKANWLWENKISMFHEALNKHL